MVIKRKTSAEGDVASLDNRSQSAELLPSCDDESIIHLKRAISGGKHWYIALLEAIGLWTTTEEDQNGRHYRYLIDGEAFDWVLLAERLCESIDGAIPDDEKLALLFHSKPPVNLPMETFKELIGSSKYRQHLNYFYGVTVETDLILAVQEEVRKERRTSGFNRESDFMDEVYRRIYGATQATLLKQFRKKKGYPQCMSISLTELKEFTYWLFKYRLEHCEKAKVASDTKKALEQLGCQGITNGFPTTLAFANGIEPPLNQE